MALNILTDGQTGDVYFTPYRSYVALITQVGVNAPTAIVLNSNDSNFLGNIVWNRSTDGVYTATLNNAFTVDKTMFFFSNGGGDPEMNTNYFFTSEDVIELDVYLAGTLEDDCLANASIEIRVYP